VIILVTGQPGSGKTLKAVDMLANDEQFKGRPLFVGGVPELTIDHETVPPVAEWTEIRNSPEDESIKLAYFTFPPKSIIVIDEAQRIYRPRAASSRVPPEVAAFETHRHTGVDFILITQHPGLLDANIRKLVGKHIHIAVTPFGRYSYEWTKCADPESKTERDIAARDRYVLPKRSFNLYKSSELHTKVKTKIPVYAWLFLACVVLLAGLIYYVYGRIFSKGEDNQTVEKLNNAGQSAQVATGKIGPVSLREYVAEGVARIDGLQHTAPKYDDLTKPTQVPWPSLCVIIKPWRGNPGKCRCMDQQGNEYPTRTATCEQIATKGIFKDFGQEQEAENQKQDYPHLGRNQAGQPAAAPTTPGQGGGVPMPGQPII
jgi:zona occludens toxin